MTTIDDIRGAIAGHRPRELDRTDRLKLAAVAAVVRQGDDDVEALFIHRAEDPNDPWSGHMAFPGGRVEEGDSSPLSAAIRETREEVGLDLDEQGTLIGRLSDVAAVGRGRPMGLVIEPFVFSIEGTPALMPNHEVADIVWVPLGFLRDRENRSTVPWRHGDVDLRLPCYRYDGFTIWGLTFGMVDELVTLLDGEVGGGRWYDPRNSEL